MKSFLNQLDRLDTRSIKIKAGVAGYISGACSVYMEEMGLSYEVALARARDKACKFFYARNGPEQYNKYYAATIEKVAMVYLAKFRNNKE